MAAQPIERFHGVGPVTARRMRELGVRTGADLAGLPLATLERHFGSYAGYLHRAAQGQDDRAVRAHRERKSVGAERTLDADITAPADLAAALEVVIAAVWERIDAKALAGRTVTLKLKFADFAQITRARSYAAAVRDRSTLHAAARALLMDELPVPRRVRLVGVTLSALQAREAAPLDPQAPLPL